jgi:outer membrane protein OmpA-like peptidoglycan-associated protein
VACILALSVAISASAQTGSSGTSTEQSTTTPQPPPSSNAASADTRPATTTVFGDTGLWFVPTAEVLAHGKWSVSGYRRGTNYVQGFANVGDFAGTFGVGIKDRAEIFGSFLVDTRVERDLRPIFIDDRAVGGIVDRYPRVNSGWTGDNVGDFYLGAKVNLWSEYRQNPAALALRGLVKLPTGDKDTGVSTGKADFAVDFIASKEAKQLVEYSGFAGYEWRGTPDGFDAPGGAFRWGAGAGFPSRSRLRGTLELTGLVPSADSVSITGTPITATDFSVAPLVSATENITRATAGLTWQNRSGFFIGGGISWNVPMKNRDSFNTDEDAFGDYVDWQVRIGYHPGVRVYVAPPPPPPPAPPPPQNGVPTVKANCNPCTVEIGKSSTVTADATDPDGDTLTYRWTAPSGTLANPSERQTLWTASQQEGSVPVTITVDDGKGGTASDTVNIQVTRPPVKNYTFEDVHFDFDRYSLRPEATRVLDEAVAALREDPTLRVEIEGHTCNIGTAEYNLALGDRRANAVSQYLVSRGISADRLHTISYGEERPKYDNSREETRRMNRRAALVVRLQQQ